MGTGKKSFTNSYVLKYFYLIGVILIISCTKQNQELTLEKRNQIEQEIITSYQNHLNDLKNLDYTKVMEHYADVEDHILFGDGSYWGDYQTINEIWKGFCNGVDQILEFEVSNQHVYVFSEDGAIYFYEYYNSRVSDGDTVKVDGSFSHGMERFEDGWKIVTTNVTHHYHEGYLPSDRQ